MNIHSYRLIVTGSGSSGEEAYAKLLSNLGALDGPTVLQRFIDGELVASEFGPEFDALLDDDAEDGHDLLVEQLIEAARS